MAGSGADGAAGRPAGLSRRLVLAGLASVLTGGAPALWTRAAAHQQKVAITSVLFNPRTGMLEVAHRLYLHDAEHAAAEIDPAVDLLKNEADRKAFADYVRARFTLKDEAGARVPLQPVGHEIDGPYLWVYHEAPAPAGAASLVVDDQILRDFWRDQTNTVTVEKGAYRKSLVFVGPDGAKTVPVGVRKDDQPADLQNDKKP